MTAEVKSIPLAHAVAVRLDIPYVIARKTKKPYMVGSMSVEVTSITTGAPQTLWLDGKDLDLVQDKRVVIVDDVISTGSTLVGMRKLVEDAGGAVLAEAAVFTEGNDPTTGSISFRWAICPCLWGKNAVLEKAEEFARRYDELNAHMADPRQCIRSVAAGGFGARTIRNDRIVSLYRDYRAAEAELTEAALMVETETDPEMADLAQRRGRAAARRAGSTAGALRYCWCPKTPNDDKNVIVEIRAGTGGDEAGLFAADLFRMYSRWAEEHGCKIESDEPERNRRRRIQGSHLPGARPRRLLAPEVRERRPPRAARAHHGGPGPHPHLDGDRGRAARSG